MNLDIPGWVATALASLLGFAMAWAAMRVTVAGLKDDVASLKSLVLTVTTLQAQHSAMTAEIERVRLAGHETRNRLQELAVDVASLKEK